MDILRWINTHWPLWWGVLPLWAEGRWRCPSSQIPRKTGKGKHWEPKWPPVLSACSRRWDRPLVQLTRHKFTLQAPETGRRQQVTRGPIRASKEITSLVKSVWGFKFFFFFLRLELFWFLKANWLNWTINPNGSWNCSTNYGPNKGCLDTHNFPSLTILLMRTKVLWFFGPAGSSTSPHGCPVLSHPPGHIRCCS